MSRCEIDLSRSDFQLPSVAGTALSDKGLLGSPMKSQVRA